MRRSIRLPVGEVQQHVVQWLAVAREREDVRDFPAIRRRGRRTAPEMVDVRVVVVARRGCRSATSARNDRDERQRARRAIEPYAPPAAARRPSQNGEHDEGRERKAAPYPRRPACGQPDVLVRPGRRVARDATASATATASSQPSREAPDERGVESRARERCAAAGDAGHPLADGLEPGGRDVGPPRRQARAVAQLLRELLGAPKPCGERHLALAGDLGDVALDVLEQLVALVGRQVRELRAHPREVRLAFRGEGDRRHPSTSVCGASRPSIACTKFRQRPLHSPSSSRPRSETP